MVMSCTSLRSLSLSVSVCLSLSLSLLERIVLVKERSFWLKDRSLSGKEREREKREREEPESKKERETDRERQTDRERERKRKREREKERKRERRGGLEGEGVHCSTVRSNGPTADMVMMWSRRSRTVAAPSGCCARGGGIDRGGDGQQLLCTAQKL